MATSEGFTGSLAPLLTELPLPRLQRDDKTYLAGSPEQRAHVDKRCVAQRVARGEHEVRCQEAAGQSRTIAWYVMLSAWSFLGTAWLPAGCVISGKALELSVPPFLSDLLVRSLKDEVIKGLDPCGNNHSTCFYCCYCQSPDLQRLESRGEGNVLSAAGP